MNFFVRLQVLLSVLCFAQFCHRLEASYQCGIRQRGFHPLAHHGWEGQEGQWPWHAAIFHKREGVVGFEYGCGGTLVNEKHVLTAAHCVVRRQAKNSLPAILYEIQLHLGQHLLSKITDNVVIRDVSKAHVHPDYSTNRNDIAVLVMRLPVEYSEYVIPICLDQRVDRDLRELEGKRGWIAGWGKTENDTVSDVLRTLSLPVVGYLQCLKDDPILFGNILNEQVFCAGNRNGTSPGLGDSGGGLYVSDGDRWVLRGVVSFGKLNELKQGINPFKYTVFVNFQQYLTWTKEVFAQSEPRRDRRQKRISEIECERFQRLTAHRRNGDCFNYRLPHIVKVTRPDGVLLGNGVLVDENSVITTCSCIRDGQYRPAKVRIEAYGDVDISLMFCHPKHVEDKIHYDLAVIKLERMVELTSSFIPACLATNWTENLYDFLLKTSFARRFIDNTPTFIASENKWQEERDTGATNLIESDQNRITTHDKCYDEFGSKMFNSSINSGELCVINELDAKDFWGNANKIIGDVLQSSNRRSCMFTIVGLKTAASVKDFATYSNLEIYGRISHHLDWIEDSVWNVQPTDQYCGVLGEYPEGAPWTVSIYHWNLTSSTFEFACTGTLVSKLHILTTAQCAVNHTTGIPLPEDTFKMYASQKRLDEQAEYEQTRYVSKVYVHPEHSVNDLAMLVANWPLKITEYVRPICMVSGDFSEFWKLEGQDVATTGWETHNGSMIRRPSGLKVLGHRRCSNASSTVDENQLSQYVYCAGYVPDPFDTYVGEDEMEPEKVINVADSGSAVMNQFFITKAGRSHAAYGLIGIVSSTIPSQTEKNGTAKYVLFVNVQPYAKWIEEIVVYNGSHVEKRPKRISEKECERFRKLTKTEHGVCKNAGNSDNSTIAPHVVTIVSDEQEILCSGVLVNKNSVLTACLCIRGLHRPTKVAISTYGVVKISAMICHPEYNSSNSLHDLAILKLATPVELSSRLIPACLANSEKEDLSLPILKSALVGKIPKYPDEYSEEEQSTYYDSTYEYIASGTECESVISSHLEEDYTLKPSQFCLINNPSRYFQFNGSAIQSEDNLNCRFTVLGIGTARKYDDEQPEITIANRVSSYLDWIEEVVWDGEASSQQNWTLVTKAEPRAAAARRSDGLKLLILCIVLATTYIV